VGRRLRRQPAGPLCHEPDGLHRGWRHRANELSETTKLFTLLGTYVREHHGSRFYGKAMNLTRQLTAAYDAALADYDLLLMPTTPMKAQPLPEAGRLTRSGRRTRDGDGREHRPVDVSHHPAMAVAVRHERRPAPVSVMLVGKHFDEPTIYRGPSVRAGRRLEEDVTTIRNP